MDCQCRCGGIAEGQTLGELEAVRSTRDYPGLRPPLRHSRLIALTPILVSYRRHLACTSDILEDNQRNLYSAEALYWDLHFAIQD